MNLGIIFPEFYINLGIRRILGHFLTMSLAHLQTLVTRPYCITMRM